MSAPWSAEQHEWLQAMGFDVLSLVPSADAAAPGASATQPAAAAAAPPVSTIDPTAPLMQALLRAARCDAAAEVMAEVAAIDGGLSRLRADPAAKRALWPRLRALRAKGLAGVARPGAAQ